jgi:hypothetical protein
LFLCLTKKQEQGKKSVKMSLTFFCYKIVKNILQANAPFFLLFAKCTTSINQYHLPDEQQGRYPKPSPKRACICLPPNGRKNNAQPDLFPIFEA